MGCVHLYCGDGKGKTTAAIGLTVRMAGTGKQAVVARFLKTDQSGEVEILKCLAEVTLIPCEKTFGFTWKMTEEVKREAAAYYKSVFETACREAVKRCGEAEARRKEKLNSVSNQIPVPDWKMTEECLEKEGEPLNEKQSGEVCDVLLVFDEICASLSSGLLALPEVLDFLDHRPTNLEVVLTGRKPPQELLDRADYITEMKQIRHPFERKLPARRGVEY